MPKIISNKSNVDLDYPVVRPSLDLDFTQEELDPRITFSRGSIGTRVNRNRLIETVAANQPRFDYDPISGECRGLLIEESRTNLFTYSEDFDNVIWTSTFGENAVVTSNQITSPDGNNTADLIRFTPNSTIQSRKTQNVGTQSGTFTVSIFVKAGTLQQILLYVTTSQSPFPSIVYNFNTDTITNNGATGTRTLYPNGWIRLTATATVTSHTMYPGLIAIKPGTLYAWGAQLEAGAFPTSYIPTDSTPGGITRSADLASMTGTNFSSWYNQTEGTLYAAINNITTRTSITYDAFVSLAGTDVNRNVIRIYTQTASGGGGQNKFFGAVAYSPDGSYVFNSFDGNVGGPDRIGKAILSYKKDNFAFTVNGLAPTRDVGGDIPTCNQLLIFGASRFQPAPSGTISRLTYYPRALKPSQLQYLTQ